MAVMIYWLICDRIE